VHKSPTGATGTAGGAPGLPGYSSGWAAPGHQGAGPWPRAPLGSPSTPGLAPIGTLLPLLTNSQPPGAEARHLPVPLTHSPSQSLVPLFWPDDSLRPFPTILPSCLQAIASHFVAPSGHYCDFPGCWSLLWSHPSTCPTPGTLPASSGPFRHKSMDLGSVGPTPLGRRGRGFQAAVLDSSSFCVPPTRNPMCMAP